MPDTSEDDIKIARHLCKTDLKFLCRDILGMKSWDVCHDWLGDFLAASKKNKKMVLLPREHLKCLPSWERVLVRGGEYLSVKDLQAGDFVRSLGCDLKGKWNKVLAKQSNGEREIFKLKLRSGREISATGNHPFFVYRGWKELKELVVGDKIAAIRSVPVGLVSGNKNLLRFLGFMIGDGCISRMMFTNKCPESRKMFIEDCYALGGEAYERIPKFRSSYVGIRKLRNIFKQFGLHKAKSADKFVPKVIFGMDNESVSEFLKALYTCDGTARTGRGAISYCSISKRLCLDIQSLLLRFGILSVLHDITIKVRNEPYNVYHLTISYRKGVDLFLEKIGFFGEKGEDAKSRLTVFSEMFYKNGRTGRALDTIPKEWRRDLSYGDGSRLRNVGIRVDTKRYSTTREKVLDTANFVKSDLLKQVAESNIYWDEIVEISPNGKCEVFDIEVENDHNFVVNDIFSHNTSILTVGKSIQHILKNPNATILFANAVQGNAETFLREVKEHLVKSKLPKLFGEFISEKWNETEIIITQRKNVDKTPTYSVAGADKAVTSQHYDIIFLDDIVNRQTISTLDQMQKTIKFYSDCLDLLKKPDGILYLIGTRWDERDIYGHVLKYWGNEFDVLNLQATTDGLLRDEDKVIFKKKFSIPVLKELRKMKGSYEFNAQYMNTITSPETRIFNPPVRYWDMFDVMTLGSAITFDPATSNKKESCDAVLLASGLNESSQLCVLGYSIFKEEQKTPMTILGKLFDYVQRFGIRNVIVETNGGQEVWVYLIEDEAKKRKTTLNVIPVHQNKSKESRILALQPYWERGDLLLKRGMIELEGQFDTFRVPVNGLVDVLDALAMRIQEEVPMSVNSARNFSEHKSRKSGWNNGIYVPPTLDEVMNEKVVELIES